MLVRKKSKTWSHCFLHTSRAKRNSSEVKDPVVCDASTFFSTLSNANRKVALGSSCDGRQLTCSFLSLSRAQLTAPTKNFRSIPASRRARDAAFMAHARSYQNCFKIHSSFKYSARNFVLLNHLIKVIRSSWQINNMLWIWEKICTSKLDFVHTKNICNQNNNFEQGFFYFC